MFLSKHKNGFCYAHYEDIDGRRKKVSIIINGLEAQDCTIAVTYAIPAEESGIFDKEVFHDRCREWFCTAMICPFDFEDVQIRWT